MIRTVTSFRRPLRQIGLLGFVRRLPKSGLGWRTYFRVMLCWLYMLWSAAVGQTVFPHVGLEGTYGQGTNEALLVVDFWPGNGAADSFAWSVRFGTAPTDTISGYQLLQVVQEASQGAFTVEATYFGPDRGYFIDSISYAIGPTLYQSRGWPAGFLSYWNSAGPNPGWSASWVGASFRLLGHSQADGWLNMPPPDDWTDPDANWPKPVLPPPFSTWSGAGTAPSSWGDPANWSGPVPQSPGDAARLGMAIGYNNAVVRLDGQRWLGTLRIQTEIGSYHIQPGSEGVLRFANNGDWATLAIAAGEHRISAPIVLDDNLILHAAGQSRLDVAAPVVAAQRKILKDGSATVAFRWPIIDLTSLTVDEGQLKVLSLEGSGQIRIDAGALLDVGYIEADSVSVGGATGKPGRLVLRGILPTAQDSSQQLAAPVPEPASGVLLAAGVTVAVMGMAARAARR